MGAWQVPKSVNHIDCCNKTTAWVLTLQSGMLLLSNWNLETTD